MKNKIYLILIALILILNFCGCQKGEDVLVEEEICFASFTQDERATYVETYLKEEYGFEAKVGEVKRRKDGVYFLEDEYFAIANCKDGTVIECWVSENGKIRDSKFLNDLEEPINQFFTEKIANKLNDCIVVCECTLVSPTERVWTKDEIEEMLLTEDIEVIVRIFANKNEEEAVERQYESKFDGVFSFASGACYIYLIDKEDFNDVNNIEWPINYRLFVF